MTSAPGADDNATGVAAVLEAARVMSPHAFEHDVWFVLTAAEEQGSLGSKHMVGWLKTQGVNVKGVIAPDMIGYWPKGEQDQFDILGDPASSFLVDKVSDVATRQGVAHKKYIEHTYCYGDDHTNFQEAGFPAITPMDCVEAHNISGSMEDTPHYHRPTDTLATLHMGFTTKVVGVITTTLAELAVPARPRQ
jgi:Zn-dependent M28 family amino/carboxypeptidase